jgi:hypothetical protein
MNKQDLIEGLEKGRREFLTSIEGLTDEQMTEPGVAGAWSVKDILAHVSRWEAELISLLFQAQQGRQPVTDHFSAEPVDESNARWYKETKDRPLDRVLNDFRAVRQQTIKRVQAFSDKDLTDLKRFPWLGGDPLAEWITSDTVEHEAEHAIRIREWRAERGI